MIISEFYIETVPSYEGESVEYYQLTCTTDFTITHSGTASSHPTVDRKTISDSYINQSVTISCNGVVSNIVNLSLDKIQRTVGDNVNSIVALKETGNPFTIHYDSQVSGEGLTNCVFTSLTFTKGSGYGTSYDVSFTAQQILKSSKVSIIDEEFKQDSKVNSQSSGKSTSGNTATTEVRSNSTLNALAKAAGGDD